MLCLFGLTMQILLARQQFVFDENIELYVTNLIPSVITKELNNVNLKPFCVFEIVMIIIKI